VDSIAEVFGTVLGGACLAIPSATITENPVAFIESCRELQATRISLVPTILEVHIINQCLYIWRQFLEFLEIYAF
jgi:non-ribosomal peptide synthetase component F